MRIIRNIVLLALLSGTGLLFAMEPININTAGKDVLMELKGIGDKRAEAIINYREQNGRFKSLADLANVRGISESIVEKNKEQLTTDSTD